ncbi:hypothetical protein, partial [Streptomyces sp. NPDC006999]|uniref:hypothetical protein n=1 Tax=Streptomyces sp. NPDC006999 TaxID=3156909 RepID=UPI0033FF040F
LPGIDVDRVIGLGRETYPGGEPGLFNMAVMGRGRGPPRHRTRGGTTDAGRRSRATGPARQPRNACR